VGPNGICAVKLLGDTWDSNWIGCICSIPTWYGIIRDMTPSLLCFYKVSIITY
jgi:hypothetical protein